MRSIKYFCELLSHTLVEHEKQRILIQRCWNSIKRKAFQLFHVFSLVNCFLFFRIGGTGILFIQSPGGLDLDPRNPSVARAFTTTIFSDNMFSLTSCGFLFVSHDNFPKHHAVSIDRQPFAGMHSWVYGVDTSLCTCVYVRRKVYCHWRGKVGNKKSYLCSRLNKNWGCWNCFNLLYKNRNIYKKNELYPNFLNAWESILIEFHITQKSIISNLLKMSVFEMFIFLRKQNPYTWANKVTDKGLKKFKWKIDLIFQHNYLSIQYIWPNAFLSFVPL